MNFLRYGTAGAGKPAIVDVDGKIRDLSAHVADFRGAALAPDALVKFGEIGTRTLL